MVCRALWSIHLHYFCVECFQAMNMLIKRKEKVDVNFLCKCNTCFFVSSLAFTHDSHSFWSSSTAWVPLTGSMCAYGLAPWEKLASEGKHDYELAPCRSQMPGTLKPWAQHRTSDGQNRKALRCQLSVCISISSSYSGFIPRGPFHKWIVFPIFFLKCWPTWEH